MKISVTKIWIFAILLTVILVSSILLAVNLQGKINKLNAKVADLNSFISTEKQSSDDTLTENQTVKAQYETVKAQYDAAKAENAKVRADNEALSAENETLSTENETLKQYQLIADAPNGFEIAIDQRLDPALVDMIKKHFHAIATGNIDEYRDTLADTDSDYLLAAFESRKHTVYDITAISAEVFNVSALPNGGYFLTVSFLKDGTVNRYDEIGVTKRGGKWVVYDYD